MCRFIAHFSDNQNHLKQYLFEEENALITQSQRPIPAFNQLNADGFGLAWYDHPQDKNPGLFRSTQPVWNEINLKHLVQKISPPIWLAHIRASTIGDVAFANCHPFSHDGISLVHNGSIAPFHTIRRALTRQLDDDLFLAIKGQTDSEHLFYLILQMMRKNHSLQEATRAAILWMTKQLKSQGDDLNCRINLAITDGHEIIATRFSGFEEASIDLHFCLKDIKNGRPSLTISSEPLDQNNIWKTVPHNTMIVFKGNQKAPRLIAI